MSKNDLIRMIHESQDQPVNARSNDLQRAWNQGFNEGLIDASNVYYEKALPVQVALTHLENSVMMLTAYVSVTQYADRRVLDVLRRTIEPFAELLAAQYTTLVGKIRQWEGYTFPPDKISDIAEAIAEAVNAIQAFVSKEDDGVQLRVWADGRANASDWTMHLLSQIDLGGAPVNVARDWIGREVVNINADPNVPSKREAVKLLYRRLISVQDENKLSPIEAAALAELDIRDDGIFRKYGNIPERVYNYARQAANDWQKKKR